MLEKKLEGTQSSTRFTEFSKASNQNMFDEFLII
jgi:hypothetical protein